MPCKFQVGQRVRCVDNEGYENRLTIGETYKILDVRANDNQNPRGGRGWFVSVLGNNGREAKCYEYRFESVEEKVMFRVGDVVRLDNGIFHPDYRGAEAEITLVEEELITATMDDGITQQFRDHNDVTMIAPVVQEGDRVKINPLSPDFARYNGQSGGGSGVVTMAGGANIRDFIVHVRWDNGHLNSYRRVDLLRDEEVGDAVEEIKKFWMIIRDDARQTQKRHGTYDEVVEESKRLADGDPEHQFIILEALVSVKKDGTTYKAENLE